MNKSKELQTIVDTVKALKEGLFSIHSQHKYALDKSLGH